MTVTEIVYGQCDICGGDFPMDLLDEESVFFVSPITYRDVFDTFYICVDC